MRGYREKILSGKETEFDRPGNDGPKKENPPVPLRKGVEEPLIPKIT